MKGDTATAAAQPWVDRVTIDTAKATGIQKELSQLKSELEQKAFAHRLEVRQLLPQDVDGSEYGRGGFGRGYGRHCQ